MIVPRTRLLVWVAMIVLPFATLGGTIPHAEKISAAFIGALLFAVVIDAVAAHRPIREDVVVTAEENMVFKLPRGLEPAAN